jgi:hypothetical protein
MILGGGMMEYLRYTLLVLTLTLPICQVSVAAEKVRIFVTDSDSWTSGGGVVGVDGALVGSGQGGARPQTAEIIKTFNERCPEFTVTMNRANADYVVLLDHEGGKAPILKDNKVVVFDDGGDAIYSGSTAVLGNAVKDACNAIWKTRPRSTPSP